MFGSDCTSPAELRSQSEQPESIGATGVDRSTPDSIGGTGVDRSTPEAIGATGVDCTTPESIRATGVNRSNLEGMELPSRIRSSIKVGSGVLSESESNPEFYRSQFRSSIGVGVGFQNVE
uniref:Uncharacterized protein n=1 Tax=Anopheles culicifacies TaxID=139723 RepID=A0A182MH56_9DIPT